MVVLMAILQAGKSAYGVTIKKQIELRTEREISRGSIYITLERLERKGYVIGLGWGNLQRSGAVGRNASLRSSPRVFKLCDYHWETSLTCARAWNPCWRTFEH